MRKFAHRYHSQKQQNSLVSANLRNGSIKWRHLNESQRAVVASRLANLPQAGTGANQYSRPANLPISSINQLQAAEMLTVSPRTIRTVKAIEREAPDLLPRIESNKKRLPKDGKRLCVPGGGD